MSVEIDFPSLVKRIRAAGDLTQEQLAHQLGVTFGTVNAWENRKHRPSPLAMKSLMHLAAEMGLAVEGPGDGHRGEGAVDAHGGATEARQRENGRRGSKVR